MHLVLTTAIGHCSNVGKDPQKAIVNEIKQEMGVMRHHALKTKAPEMVTQTTRQFFFKKETKSFHA